MDVSHAYIELVYFFGDMRSKYTDVSIFLALENAKNVTKRHDFFF